jgi:RHS repeat-associated protein
MGAASENLSAGWRRAQLCDLPHSGFANDAAGNLATDGSAGYQWDAEGRLISITNGAGTLRSSVYNALGREVEWHADGRVSEDLTDLAGNSVGGVDPSTGAWTGERIPGGKIYLAWYVNGGTTFFHYNALGSTVMNTRQDGTVSNDIIFYPWGQVWTSPVNDYFQFFGSIPNWDWELSEGVTPNRYYPNTQGRWLSPDPAGLKAVKLDDPQTWNMYAYVRNNPTTLTDPSGLLVQCSSSLSKKDMGTCLSIQNAAYEKDQNGNYKYQKLHDIYTRLNDDPHVFTIDNVRLKGSAVGNTILEGTNSTGTDFRSATLQIDFNKLKGMTAPSSSDKVPGFNMFAGIIGKKTLEVIENFGHEGAHGVWALNNMNLAVTLQNLINIETPMHWNNPQLLQLEAVSDPLLRLTETYAQQQEQVVNTELNANPQ